MTANKGPAAFAFRTLAAAARRANRQFLFESAVMDGIPLFNLKRATLPALSVKGFEGVVNSTTNHILTAMENGQRFEDALVAMQRAGIAEADASLDVDGWDAAAKTAALANVLLGANLTPHSVEREGIAGDDDGTTCTGGARCGPATQARRVGCANGTGHPCVRAAWSSFRRPICSRNSRVGRTPSCSTPTSSATSPSSSAGSGLTLTAYGLVSDLVTIARDWSADARHSASAAASASGSYPVSTRSPMIVTGTTLKPRATRSSYARSSSSTLYASNGTRSRERNSFTCSQLRQELPA